MFWCYLSAIWRKDVLERWLPFKATIFLTVFAVHIFFLVSFVPLGTGLAISYPYFRKIDSGSEVNVQGRVSVYCYYTVSPQNGSWYYSNQTRVPENPLSYELKSKFNEAKKEYVLSTNEFSFSLLNKDRYICNLGPTQSNLEVSLIPRSGKIRYCSACESCNWLFLCVTNNRALTCYCAIIAECLAMKVLVRYKSTFVADEDICDWHFI